MRRSRDRSARAVGLIGAAVLVACSTAPSGSAPLVVPGLNTPATASTSAQSAQSLTSVPPSPVAPLTSGSGSAEPSGPSPAPSTAASPTGASPTPDVPTEAPAPPPPAATDCPELRCVSVVVTGDVLLHEPLWEQASRDGGGAGRDFGPLLAGQAPYLAESDVAVCHLETPLAATGSDPEGYPDFAVPAEIATALADVGYDACSTASNHTLDQGTDGVAATLDALDAARLQHAGSARTEVEAAVPTIIDSPDGAVALISATYGLNTGSNPDPPWEVEIIDVATIIGQARAARAAGADLVIVAMHAGVEYQHEPTDDQRQTARALLESPEIDFVYGHHAHVVQPLESIGGKWVAYGLGNTVAAHGIVDLGNREGLLVRVTFGQRADGTWRTTDVGWVPSLVDDAVPYRWCALQPGSACSDDDATSRDRITAVVDAEGAAEAGAHLWTP